MSSACTTCALLLRSVDYRESDRILTLFTEERGKVSALARGARASKRRFSGVLEPYAVIRVELAFGRGELASLKGASIVRSFSSILADLPRMQTAAAGLSLVRELTAEHDTDAALFRALVEYLGHVDEVGDPERAVLLGFSLRALALLGLSPQLERCGRTGEPVPPGRAALFDPLLGAVVARKAGGGPHLLSGSARARLLTVQGPDWLEAATPSWAGPDLHEARSAVAAFLSAHLSVDVGPHLFPHA